MLVESLTFVFMALTLKLEWLSGIWFYRGLYQIVICSDSYLVFSIQPDISRVQSERPDNYKKRITVNNYLEKSISRDR